MFWFLWYCVRYSVVIFGVIVFVLDFCIFIYGCLFLFSLVVFFFFKQKTAYELRISDWSSDVCSSDLRGPLRTRNAAGRQAARRRARDPRTGHDAFRDRRCGGQCRLDDLDRRKHFRQPAHRQRLFPQQRTHRFRPRADEGWRTDREPRAAGQAPAVVDVADHRLWTRRQGRACGRIRGRQRSEEHTSELTSLMSTAYADLCLKKKIN